MITGDYLKNNENNIRAKLNMSTPGDSPGPNNSPDGSSILNPDADVKPDETYLYEITCIHNTKRIIKKHINNIKNTHNITNPLNPNSFIKQLIRALETIGNREGQSHP